MSGQKKIDLLSQSARGHKLRDEDELGVAVPTVVEVDDVGVTDSFKDFDFLRQFSVFLFGSLEAVPGNLIALLAVDALVDDFVGAFA